MKFNSYHCQSHKQFKKGGSYLPFGDTDFEYVPRLTRIRLGFLMILGIEIKYIHVNIINSSPMDVQKWVDEHPELKEALEIAVEAFKED